MENKTTKQLKKELRIAEVIAKAKEEERKIQAKKEFS